MVIKEIIQTQNQKLHHYISCHHNGTNNLLVGLINGLKVPLISSHLLYEYLHLMVEGQNYHLPTLL